MQRILAFLACSWLLAASPVVAQTQVYHDTPPTLTNGQTTGLEADINGNLKVTLSGATGSSGSQVQGVAAQGGSGTSNPLKIGCAVEAAPTTVGADGTLSHCKVDGRGYVWTSLGSGGASAMQSTASAGDGLTNTQTRVSVEARNAVFNGTSWDRLRGDTNGLVALPGLSSTYWSYTSGTAGILSNTTTAVTIKTAAGASVRNYIDACTINTTAFGASVPIAIRDGAGGTVLFALSVPTAGFLQPVTIMFPMPLRGTANTLLEVVTTTANTSGTAWVNCQGHTGA
jgi:hypothetical protein